jgi:hypothetical protein
MRRAARVWLVAALLAGAAASSAQVAPGAAPAPAPEAAPPTCPANGSELPTASLFGTWEARFEGLPGVATVQLGKHPDYDGVRGTIRRDGSPGAPATVAQLAGDIGDDGMLNLDESEDGKAISGVWLGELQAASCGKEFKGVWRNAKDDSTHSFVLTKTGLAAGDR